MIKKDTKNLANWLEATIFSVTKLEEPKLNRLALGKTKTSSEHKLYSVFWGPIKKLPTEFRKK